MRIGIYDKWLATFGGGEKVATVMAEVLSKKGHSVEIISNFEVSKDELEKKMGVNLSKSKMCYWFERSYDKLSPRTKKYDLFINVSFLDHLPSKAKKSLYYVHFPTPIRAGPWSFIKYEKILPFLRKFLIIPEVQLGIENLDDIYTRGGKWLGSKNDIVFYNVPSTFKFVLRIYSEQIKISTLGHIAIKSPNAKIERLDQYMDHTTSVLTYKYIVNKSRDESPIIQIVLGKSARKLGYGLVSLTVYDLRYFLWNFLKRYFPKYEMALYGSSSYKPGVGLDTYNMFLANSKFTQKWTKKYWGKDSSVMYPPVEVEKFKPGKKKNIILNVGRFFFGGHSKRQDILVKTFKKMRDEGLIDNTWELHFVGGVALGEKHDKFLDLVQSEARGYSVFFHFSVPFEYLRNLYSSAKIYWHATGYGLNENKYPIQFEHFGISVVEAMAAGAVPVVFRGGGLTESVSNDEGKTWKTLNELVKYTSEIIKDKSLMRKLSLAARKKAQTFSKARFSHELIEIVNKL